MFLCGDSLDGDWASIVELSQFHLGVILFFLHLYALIYLQEGSPLNRLYFLHGGAKLQLAEVLPPVAFLDLIVALMSDQLLKHFH